MSTDEFMNHFLDGKLGGKSVPDPMRAAQRSMRQDMPKRFYKDVAFAPLDGHFALTLDGKKAKTPARHPLAMPDEVLARALCHEWQEQVDIIDPATMPLTRLANVALDRVSQTMDEVRADIAKYAGSDLLCYRAAHPERLADEQLASWNPILEWARQELGAAFALSNSIVHVAQPQAALDAVAKRLAEISSPFAMTALHMVTTLTGSAVLALALEARSFDAQAIWDAAHVDEDFQISIWGEDDEAQIRRKTRRLDYNAAALTISQTSH